MKKFNYFRLKLELKNLFPEIKFHILNVKLIFQYISYVSWIATFTSWNAISTKRSARTTFHGTPRECLVGGIPVIAFVVNHDRGVVDYDVKVAIHDSLVLVHFY